MADQKVNEAGALVAPAVVQTKKQRPPVVVAERRPIIPTEKRA